MKNPDREPGRAIALSPGLTRFPSRRSLLLVGGLPGSYLSPFLAVSRRCRTSTARTTAIAARAGPAQPQGFR